MQFGFNLDMVKILYHGFAIRKIFLKGLERSVWEKTNWNYRINNYLLFLRNI